MAKRRSFSIQVLNSDHFLAMPISAQGLYVHLALRADDDGFVRDPKRIIRTVCANEVDLEWLIAKRYIIKFESGVLVIRHWYIHNHVQRDRYTPTRHTDEKKLLMVSEDGTYELAE